MPSKDPKMLGFNQYQKSDKIPSQSIIHADLESLIKKVDGCKNNPEKLSTTKVAEHIFCGCSMSAIQTFDVIKNKFDAYRDKDFMKKICESLREHVIR